MVESAEAIDDTAWTATESGLRFIDTVIGDGESPNAGDKVSVQFTVKFASNGAVIDGTREARDPKEELKYGKRTGKPVTFEVDSGAVIKGWNEGVKTMRVGGKRSLSIPPHIGYGSEGGINGKVPPDTKIVMDVEMVKLTRETIQEKLGLDWAPNYDPKVIAGVLVLAVPYFLPQGTLPEAVCGIWKNCA